MDNLSHSLVGLVVGELVQRSLAPEPDPARNRTRRRLLLTAGALASNFPDLDLVLTPLLPSPIGYLLHHRGHTHTLLYAIPQALLLIALLYALWPSARALLRDSAAAQARGVLIVAAVGNDGPAAPPAFPASYPGVVAVTGVDGRNRPLIEAGRASHLDYAAPGADMLAASADGRAAKVRGTSFAAPLVAGLAFRAGGVTRALDAQAQDLGKKGADALFGRGLLCGACRNIR